MDMAQQSAIFCRKIDEILRLHPDVRVTSGCRTRADNLRVGGVANSQHLAGLAVDLAPGNKTSISDLMKIGKRYGFVALKYGRHVHFQLFNAAEWRTIVG